MFVVYYGLPLLLLGVGIDIMRWDKMLFIYITFGLNVGAFLSEVFRSSILSVPSSQWDAAAMVGHGKARAYLSVIVPQAAVIAIPSLSYTFIMLFQDTSLTFAMGVVDVIGKAQLLGGRIFHTMEGYFVAAIIFITFSILIEKGFALLAKRLNTQGKIFKG
jgi:L-cystine transport system permease protein